MTLIKAVILCIVLQHSFTNDIDVKFKFSIHNSGANYERVTCAVNGTEDLWGIRGVTQIDTLRIFGNSEQRLATVNLESPNVVNPGQVEIEDTLGYISGKEGVISLKVKGNHNAEKYICRAIVLTTKFEFVSAQQVRMRFTPVMKLMEQMHSEKCPPENLDDSFQKFDVKFNATQRLNEKQVESLVRRISETEALVNVTAEKFDAFPDLLDSLEQEMESISLKVDNMYTFLNQPEVTCDTFRSESDYKGPLRTNRVMITAKGGIPMLCDTHTNGGRWIVIQRRVDGLLDFDRYWNDYEDGFGGFDSTFWLGLKTLSKLMRYAGSWELRVDLEYGGEFVYAEYSSAKVYGVSTNYQLKLRGYSGNAGEKLATGVFLNFTTKDRDNDKTDGRNCGSNQNGGWWYAKCDDSNLNGPWPKGVIWYGSTPVSFTEMKIRMRFPPP